MRRGLFPIVFGLLCFAFASPVPAADFPIKPIQLVIPYNPGGGSDITARIFADAMKNFLPQPVVVSNLPGATGLTGSAHVLNSRPDGYTLLWEHYSLGLTPMISDASFRWTDFDTLCTGAMSESVMVVRKDSPWNSVDDVVKAIKSNPGKVRYSVAFGGTPHFVFLQLADVVGGLDVILVPLSGDKARIVSLLGNNSDVSVTALSAAAPYIDSGDLKVVALANKKRSTFYPDFPTLRELGLNVDYDYVYTVFLPKGVPEETRKILKDAFRKAAELPETQAKLKAVTAVSFYNDSAESTRLWQEQAAEFFRVMDKAGMVKKK